MAITTYAELQTAIGNWLGRPADPVIAPIIPDWIALTEARYNRELRLRAMEARATANVSSQYLALPTEFLELRNIQLNTDPRTSLEYLEPKAIDELWAGSVSGRPRYFSIINDEIQLAPAPDAPYEAEIAYWKKVPALTATSQVNIVLTGAPDVYLFGALAEAAAYLGDDEHFGPWDARYQLAVRRLRDSDERGNAGPAMRIRPQGVSFRDGNIRSLP
ncbi:MAG: phage adaptor protein [Dongiaceae bacterium]